MHSCANLSSSSPLSSLPPSLSLPPSTFSSSLPCLIHLLLFLLLLFLLVLPKPDLRLRNIKGELQKNPDDSMAPGGILDDIMPGRKFQEDAKAISQLDKKVIVKEIPSSIRGNQGVVTRPQAPQGDTSPLAEGRVDSQPKAVPAVPREPSSPLTDKTSREPTELKSPSPRDNDRALQAGEPVATPGRGPPSPTDNSLQQPAGQQVVPNPSIQQAQQQQHQQTGQQAVPQVPNQVIQQPQQQQVGQQTVPQLPSPASQQAQQQQQIGQQQQQQIGQQQPQQIGQQQQLQQIGQQQQQQAGQQVVGQVPNLAIQQAQLQQQKSGVITMTKQDRKQLISQPKPAVQQAAVQPVQQGAVQQVAPQPVQQGAVQPGLPQRQQQVGQAAPGLTLEAVTTFLLGQPMSDKITSIYV